MPEETVIVSHLEQALDLLEDYTLGTHMLRSQNYYTVKNVLDSGGNINGIVIERLLAVCIHDLKEDVKYTVMVLNIISLILKKIKAGDCSPLPDVVPSAMAIINFINITASKNKIETLQTLCIDTLLLYPDDALIKIATSFYTELMETFSLYCRQCVPIELQIQPVKIVSKLLKILPPDKRMIFVKNGLNIWFSKVIPTIILYISTSNTGTSMSLETLEALTTELLNIDYADNPQWHCVLESIYNPQKYPTVMKSLLESGSDIWHRLWIVFIKLLKNQITINNNKVGTPINSMLPVVEMAFKLDIVNRCRAFDCWNVLIDNFSTETNEVLMNKRLKLLIVPLKSNNAKVEETVLAKLNSWWHLIRRFQNKMDKFTDVIVIPFLHFCFGKHINSGKSIFVPGLLSDNTKIQCAQVFVEIVGHVNCNGCTNLPKLKKKIINEQLLIDHLSDWLFSLTTVIKILIKENKEVTKQQIMCVWKSFILTISELPENDIRKDFFNGFLGILPQLVKDCQKDDGIFVILKLLLISLYNEENKLLFTTKYKQNNLINSILFIMRDPTLNNFYKSFPNEQSVTFLKPVTNYIVNELLLSSDDIINNILKDLPTDDNTLLLWTAFAESMIELNHDKCPDNLSCHMLLWPLKSLNSFIDVKYSSVVWNKMYNLWYPKLNKTSINSDILETLFNTKITSINAHFLLCVFIALLKFEMDNDNSSEIEKKAEYLLNVVKKLPDCFFIEHTVTYKLMMDILITILNKTTVCVNVSLAKYTILIVNHVLKLMNQGFKQDKDMNTLVFTKNFFTCIENLFKIEIFNHFKFIIVDNMIDCLQQSSLRKFALPILKTFKLTSKDDDILFYRKIESALKTFDNITESKENDMNDNKFTTPDHINKKAKKKDVNIVNTVVEDGEEYVVVKSNWKFNPKKLTENQREKLQRKREDIPALYQDLSQSQDDFKLTTWKTDSQDTSLTSSKPASKSSDQDVTTILKNIPNSNCVPKILENILSENVKKDNIDTINEKTEYDTYNKIQQPPSVKITKSNITLKDRVFRNVRNLIEKSVVQNDNKKVPENLNQIMTDNICKTPLKKVNHPDNLSNSAPSNISLDRPSRLKRKPKKFEDSEIFSSKKRRHSFNQNDLQLSSEICSKPVINVPTISNITEDTKCIDSKKPSINETETSTGDQENNDICLQVVEVKVDNSSLKNTCDSTNETNKALENIHNYECSKESKARNVTEELSEAIKPNINIDVPENAQIKVHLPSKDTNISSSNVNETSVKKTRTKKDLDAQKSSTKKTTVKKSRIEKELAIDMVEGHPFLKTQSEKRLTRKCLSNITSSSRRRCLTEKFENSKLDSKSTTKSDKRSKETKDKSQKITKTSSSESDIQDKCSNSLEELPLSADVIESSQDSTLTTISVKSIKTACNKVPLIALENIQEIIKNHKTISETQDVIKNSPVDVFPFNQDNEDIKRSQNDTVIGENSHIDLTENMNTEPVDNKQFSNSGEVIVISDNETPIAVTTDDIYVTLDTQEIANADTELIEINEFSENKISDNTTTEINISNDTQTINIDVRSESKINANIIDLQDDSAKNVSELTTVSIEKETSGVSSPLKDDNQRKKEFLNDTLEISPIKSLSPVREKKSPSPETSNDYVVIQLSSPVQSNGEPFEKCDSPEIFTEDKISPDKRNQSPPRQDVVINNPSPSSSLSLKKNRPQVRSGGRAAQMLGLCVPDKIQTIINSERCVETEEPKKCSFLSTPARRNLRILYNSVSDINDNPDENEDSENFLKFKKSLPMADCSPSGPILKRKLSEIVDDTTLSPANKRKRVSFHDPPVSTTISVQKYIEPSGIRSPQNSALKRQERQLRMHTNLKSPRRLDTVFKLDSVLTKTIESFSETDSILACTDDTETSSSEHTPAVEVVKTSELNDTDPICPDLLHCKDPIDNIAMELSSPGMKMLLIKELEGKIESVADLAKMTELEINRLCIKAPKVKTVKKVLTEYANKRSVKKQGDENIEVNEPILKEQIMLHENRGINVEVQTNNVTLETTEMQTITVPAMTMHTQTDLVSTLCSNTQTEESGSQSTEEIINSRLLNRPDFVGKLNKCLEESSRQEIADELSLNALTDLLLKKMTTSNSSIILSKLLEHQSRSRSSNAQCVQNELSFLQDYLCNKFDSKILVLFCSQLLQKIHDKPEQA